MTPDVDWDAHSQRRGTVQGCENAPAGVRVPPEPS